MWLPSFLRPSAPTPPEVPDRESAVAVPEPPSEEVIRRLESLLCGALSGDDDALAALGGAADAVAPFGPSAPPFSNRVGEAFDAATPERRNVVWYTLAGAAETQWEPSALLDAAAAEETILGTEFALLLGDVAGKEEAAFKEGCLYLEHLIEPLPGVEESRVNVLLESPSVVSLMEEHPDLAHAMAERGLSPLSFSDAADVAGRVLRHALRRDQIEAPVHVCLDGALGAPGSLHEDHLVRAVSAFCGFGEHDLSTAEAVLTWLLAASEEQEDVFLHWEADHRGDHVVLHPRPMGNARTPRRWGAPATFHGASG